MTSSRFWLRRDLVLVALLSVLLFALDVYAVHSVFTSRYPGANDFFSRWKGAQVFWKEGLNPYSDEATLAIQEGIYGRPAQPNEDPGPFAYPFYTVFLLAPLAPLSYAWAEAVWLVILQFSLVVGVLLCLMVVDLRLSRGLMLMTALWGVAFYHSARTILLGQFAGLVFLWVVGTLWALKNDRYVVAGVLLALTTIKPQMSFLLIPALLIWGVWRRRWRFLGSFAGTMALFLGASFLLLPAWLGEFVAQVLRYPSYTAIGSPIWIVTHLYLPFLGTPGEVALSALFLLYLLVQWRHLPRAAATSDLFLWLLGLTLLVTNLVALRTATTNYAVLYIPLFFILKVAADRLTRASLWLALFYILSMVGLWALFLTTVQGDYENPIMYLPLPSVLLLGILWAKAASNPASAGRQSRMG
ncbi:MAG: glycosyltransferase family 87 protein [Anaerolineae bacterium]|jgi:hypothetical protein